MGLGKESWVEASHLFDLRNVCEAFGGVLESKVPVGEVLYLPGMGLPPYPCGLRYPLGAAQEARPCCSTVMDFGAQQLEV